MKIEKTEFGVSTNVYHYRGWLVLAVTDGAGDVLETYTHGADLSGQVGGSAGGIGGILASAQEGKSVYYHYGFNGNVVQVSDSNQEQLAKYTYSPFGEVLAREGNFHSRYQFSSKEYDVATGLNYYGFRYYSPQLGRWLSRDPIGERGGFNLYAAFFNAPVMFVDPFGREVWMDLFFDESAWGDYKTGIENAMDILPRNCEDAGLVTKQVPRPAVCDTIDIDDLVDGLLYNLSQMAGYRDQFYNQFKQQALNAAVAGAYCTTGCPSPPDSIADPFLNQLFGGFTGAAGGFLWQWMHNSPLVNEAQTAFPAFTDTVNAALQNTLEKAGIYIDQCCCPKK